MLLSTLLFQGCYVGYEHRDQKWSYASWDEGGGEYEVPIPEVEPRSFHLIPKSDFAADRHHVFYEGKIVPGADPASFVHISGNWWKDHSEVYLAFPGLETVVVEGADPRTFIVLKDHPWAKDSQRAYSGYGLVRIHDPGSFDSINQNWARDSKAYYATGSGLIKEEGEVLGADLSTFRILKGLYARDRNRIYWGTLPIKGADLGSFVAINESLAKDKTRTYLCGEPR